MRYHPFVAAALLSPLLWFGAPSYSQRLRSFCAAAAKPVRSDPKLSEAVSAAFGQVAFTSRSAEDCTYPLKVLNYPSATVLLTQGSVPGEACHGCAAHLSAYVLQRTDGGLRLVKAVPDFAQAGTFGDAGGVSSLIIGGDDAFALEAGGTFQGYSSRGLDIYVFRASRVVHLQVSPPIAISADNGGAVVDDSKAVSVAGTWAIDPASKASVVVDYKVKARGRTRTERAVWSLQGSRLVLTGGRVPPEVEQASGSGG